MPQRCDAIKPANPPEPIDLSACSDRVNRYYAVLLGIATEAEIEDRAEALKRASDDLCRDVR
jgi:hypothetical protein